MFRKYIAVLILLPQIGLVRKSGNGSFFGMDIAAASTIDAVPIAASTFLGGSRTDDNYEPSLALDRDGHVFVSGFTGSPDFPVAASAFSSKFNGGATDRFIARFGESLQSLNASTFIGGGGLAAGFVGGNGDEYGHGIALDKNGHVFIAGYTESPDYPVTENGYNKTHNGGRDVAISKFNHDLTRLLASTFVGGCGDEGYQWPRIDIKVDDEGNVYVAGITHSVDFPVSRKSFDPAYNGGPGSGDVFVIKLDNDLTTLKASTFLGGAGDEWRVSIELGRKGEVIVCGETASADFPVTTDAYNRTFNGGTDIFISKLDGDLAGLTSSTFFGGSRPEEAIAVSVSEDDDVYITGYTESTDFPVTSGVFSPRWNGGDRDAYIAVFDSCLSRLKASTLIGGEAVDFSRSIRVVEDAVLIVGNTNSKNFPVTAESFSSRYQGGSRRGDGFISVFDRPLKRLLYSSYFGGGADDTPCDMELDAEGRVIITGITTSSDFPTTGDSFQKKYNGGETDCFVVMFKFNPVRGGPVNSGRFSPSVERRGPARAGK